MEILSQIIHIVDQNPDSILVMRQQTEQRLPAHQHNKAQLLLVYGGIAYLQTDEKDFYIPSNHYIWIPKLSAQPDVQYTGPVYYQYLFSGRKCW
jgi:hypothetical protein